jgi:hypothetical protein
MGLHVFRQSPKGASSPGGSTRARQVRKRGQKPRATVFRSTLLWKTHPDLSFFCSSQPAVPILQWRRFRRPDEQPGRPSNRAGRLLPERIQLGPGRSEIGQEIVEASPYLPSAFARKDDHRESTSLFNLDPASNIFECLRFLFKLRKGKIGM